MNDAGEIRRKRVLFRCHHTGMKENDLFIGAFADRHLAELNDADVDWLEALVMDHNDLDINDWIMRRKPVPAELDHPVMRALVAFDFTAADDNAQGGS